MNQKASNCIFKIGGFWISIKTFCAEIDDHHVSVIGTIDRKVPESFKGELWLINAKIDRLDNREVKNNFEALIRKGINIFRENLVSVYSKSLPEPEAGLVSGIVLGYKNDIGYDFYQQMIRRGTVHIAVASGFNILLVGGFVMTFMFWVTKRKWATVVALLAMLGYAVLAGGEPPVVRAVWMASAMYLSLIVGRRSLSWWILLVTVWVMLMIDPALIISASFQLSVAASFGLTVIDPWLAKSAGKKIGEVPIELAGRLGLTTTVSAMMATTPIIWWHFGRMSLIGILSNTLILPLIPPIMILGVGMLVMPGIFFVPVYVLAHWVVGVIRFFGN